MCVCGRRGGGGLTSVSHSHVSSLSYSPRPWLIMRTAATEVHLGIIVAVIFMAMAERKVDRTAERRMIDFDNIFKRTKKNLSI